MSLSVFISHSIGPVEIPIVNHLSAALYGAGVNAYLAFYDRQPGVQLSSKVQANIDASDILLALVSKKGVDSTWVQHEVGFALGRNKKVIAFVEKGVKPGAMLQGVEYYEFDPSAPGGSVDNMAGYLKWLKSQKELAIAQRQAAIAQAEADRNLAIAETVVGIGLILFLIWALTRE
jgi:TIR domain